MLQSQSVLELFKRDANRMRKVFDKRTFQVLCVSFQMPRKRVVDSIAHTGISFSIGLLRRKLLIFIEISPISSNAHRNLKLLSKMIFLTTFEGLFPTGFSTGSKTSPFVLLRCLLALDLVVVEMLWRFRRHSSWLVRSVTGVDFASAAAWDVVPSEDTVLLVANPGPPVQSNLC